MLTYIFSILLTLRLTRLDCSGITNIVDNSIMHNFKALLSGMLRRKVDTPPNRNLLIRRGWAVALFITFGICHLDAASVGEEFTVGGVKYKVTDATNFYVTALGVADDNTLEEIDIPQQVKNNDETFTVTAYGGLGWTDDWHAKVIKLPESVTTINSSSFSNYKTLTDFYIPKSVTSVSTGLGIEAYHFPKFHVDQANTYYANDADGALYSKDLSQLYAVPSEVGDANNGTYTVREGVTKIMGHAFSGNFKKIILPASLTDLNNGYPSFTGFYTQNQVDEIAVADGNSHYKVENGALVKVDAANGNTLVYYPPRHAGDSFTVPDDVTHVGAYSLSYNPDLISVDLNKTVTAEANGVNELHNLTTLGIPASVTKIEGLTNKCEKISYYNVDENNQTYASIDGIVFSKDKTKIVLYPPARADEEYTIPEGTTTIPSNVFSGCPLKKLTVASTVTSIDDSGISSMNNLEELDFPDDGQLKALTWQAVSALPALKILRLPKNLQEIYERGINACNALEEIDIPDGSQLSKIDKGGIGAANLRLFKFEGSCQLQEIGASVFANKSKLERFDVPASVTTIGESAFTNCTSLKTLTFDPDSKLQTLGDGCFANCGFETLSLPDNITSIGHEAFRECNGLKTVHITKSVTSIDPSAFKWSPNIVEYTVDPDNPNFSSTHGMLCDKNKSTLVLFPSGQANKEATVLPPSITTIGEKAFYDCLTLTNIVIPQKVTKIGPRAFGLDKNLNSITLLCDQMLSPDNIDQTTNGMSFDDGTNGQADVVTNMYQNITIYVRKDLADQYKANSFYQKFKAIKTSFTVEHPGDNDAANTDEFLPVSQEGVMLISTKSTLPVYVAPTEVVNRSDDDEKDYKRTVSMVDNYAFENADQIKEVIFKNSIYSIGTLAFYSKTQEENGIIKPVGSSIQDIVFCGNTAPEVLMSDEYELIDNYREFAPEQKIYVKKSKLADYQEALSRFRDQVSYKLPGISISSTYGTFCREFDTDLSDFYSGNGKANVAAFVAGEYKTRINADGQEENYVLMTSIDENGGYKEDGKTTYGYIPANTGVLLKVLDQTSTPSDFYYTIGEHDDAAYSITNNLMHGVTINSTDIPASETEPIYVMSKGEFHKVTSTGKNFPAHRAYLKLPAGTNAKANLVIGFADDDQATGINVVRPASATDKHYYNLKGQAISHPVRGIYIHNGQKILNNNEE